MESEVRRVGAPQSKIGAARPDARRWDSGTGMRAVEVCGRARDLCLIAQAPVDNVPRLCLLSTHYPR